jgi:hypothetical protein
VFARLIQQLTLFAFAAHAVLGCCWHHSHAIGPHSHGIGHHYCVEHVVHLAESCEVAHDCNSHQHAGEPAAPSDCVSDVATIHAICCDGPGQHSHDCDQGQCNYFAVNLQLLDLHLNAGFVERVFCDTNLFAVACGFYSGRFYDHPEFALPVSSPQRCASMQSWQI